MTDISQDLVEQVNEARSCGHALNIVGGSSKAFLGRELGRNASEETSRDAFKDTKKDTKKDELTETCIQRVNVLEHRGIISYQPVELVMRARAGTSLVDLRAALDEHGQVLAFEPPEFAGAGNSGATIGGTLACNLSGPSRPWMGSVRDAVLGIKLINGRAEHLNFGGQVMKNVAGYDVSRLQAGAMGSLGIITEVSLKVMPKPAASETLVQCMDAQTAIDSMNSLAGKAKPLSAACWLDGKQYLRLSGAESAVQGTVKQWRGEPMDNAEVFWHSLREQQLNFFAGDAPLWRFSIKSSARHFLPEADWLIDWGGAQRWLRGNFDKAELEALAVAAGGQVSVFRGADRIAEVFHSQPRALQTLHKRLKAAFDPQGLFNPGRLYSWL